MLDPTEDFNKSSSLLPDVALKRNIERITDPVKLGILADSFALQAKEQADLDVKLDKERAGRIASNASDWAKAGQPTLELGTVRDRKSIQPAEVEAMIERGKKDGVQLGDVDPHNHREVAIIEGNKTTLTFEESERTRLRAGQDDITRKLVDDLVTLDLPEFYQSRDGSGIARDDGRTLSDEFNRTR